ncbi:MAG TPA: S8 family serine peptidase [Gemmataceae bacterium]|nr:S8 family serine peptidase [Gemmataceae bacterium]
MCPLELERLEDRLAPNDLGVGTFYAGAPNVSDGNAGVPAITVSHSAEVEGARVDAYVVDPGQPPSDAPPADKAKAPPAAPAKERTPPTDREPEQEWTEGVFSNLVDEWFDAAPKEHVSSLPALSFLGIGIGSGAADAPIANSFRGERPAPSPVFTPERQPSIPAFDQVGSPTALQVSSPTALSQVITTPPATSFADVTARALSSFHASSARIRAPLAPVSPPPSQSSNMGFRGSSWLMQLSAGYQAAVDAGQVESYLAPFRQVLTFDSANRVLVNVHSDTASHLFTLQSEFRARGMIVTQLTLAQNMVTGYFPIGAIRSAGSIANFSGGGPVYRPILRVGSANTEGDAVIGTQQFRQKTSLSGWRIRVGVVSDSVNQVDSHVDSNPDKGIAESQRTADLPPRGVIVLKDGQPTDTDEGRGMLEIIHDIAPRSQLAFHTGNGGPQAMAQGILDLADKAVVKVIVDDVAYPNEPFFNDGILAQTVDRVVYKKNIVYVTAAGNEGDRGWTDSWRPVNTVVAAVQGEFENFDVTGGTDVLQNFSLGVGQTLDLSLQWDAAFLEGGSPLANFQVPNNIDVLITDDTGTRLLRQFSDISSGTGEALERVHFTNDGQFNTTDFALAIVLKSGSAPTMLKWIRFDSTAASVEYEGAPTVFGHAAARAALTVGAVPLSQPDHAESFSSQGPVTILFDQDGERLEMSEEEVRDASSQPATPVPEIRNNKPNVVAPDGVSTANFPGQPAGQPLAPGQHPAFYGTSAAAAQVAGAAALLRGMYPRILSSTLDKLIESNAQNLGSSDVSSSSTGAGLVQLASVPQLPSRAAAPAGATVGPVVNASKKVGEESETAIAIDPTNPRRLFVGANDNSVAAGTFMWGAYSTDGGRNWTGRDIGTTSDGLPVGRGDPTLAWDRFGNLYYANVDDANNDQDNILISTDGGKTFKVLFTAAGANSNNVLDQPSLAVGPGTGGVGSTVWMVAADVGNASPIDVWGAPVTGLGTVGAFTGPVTPPGSDPGNFGDIAVGPKGQVITFYQRNDSSQPNDVFVNTDPDGLGPLPFGNPVKVTSLAMGMFNTIPAQSARQIQTKGSLAWDRSGGRFNGRVYLMYTDAPASNTNDTEIFLQFSDDNGATWSNRIRVNDDIGTNSQFMSRIAVDQRTGILAASWYDCRNDLGNGGVGDRDGVPNTDTEFYSAVSFNGGITWSRNIQLEPLPSSSIANAHNFGNDYGDYTGIAFANGTFHSVWADNSGSLNPPDVSPPEFEIATVAVQIVLAFEDRFEPNDTSDKATFLGGFGVGSQGIGNVSINIHGSGYPDYDWYRWTASANGTFTANMKIVASNGDLELHLFTVDSNNTLIELARDVVRDGRANRTVSAVFGSGQPILVEVKGANSAPGIHDQGNYNLALSMK